MEKSSIQGKVWIVTFWALLMLHKAAEQEYFVQDRAVTWEQARNHCQVCFKELVTLTPSNIQTIVSNLSSHYWVGLRKNISSPKRSLHIPWSLWANGDPLTFQNWYPGWPVAKPVVIEKEPSCCQGDALFENVTSANVTDTMMTQPTAESLIMNSSVPPPLEDSVYLPVYIEDSCVAMTSFGAWTEKECSKRLPFICYEEPLYSNATVSNVTSSSATLSWLAGPGNISYYRLDVNDLTIPSLANRTYDLVNLTAGTKHSVQVFSVKCGRHFSPQNVTFYSKPGKIQNLNITKLNETSVFLRWTKPVGNTSFYMIEGHGSPGVIVTDKESIEVGGLIPGGRYTLSIRTTVEDRSIWSEAQNITLNTKPEKVSDLKVSDNTNNSVQLSWAPPEGNTTAYWVEAGNGTHIFFSRNISNASHSVKVTDLPVGSRVTLNVTALAGDTVGDPVTVTNFTTPGPILNLFLPTNTHSLNASWVPPKGNYTHFIVKIQLQGTGDEIVAPNVTETTKHFDNLKTAANYTVTVYTGNEHLTGPPFSCFNITLPVPPSNVSIASLNKSHITVQWNTPSNAATSKYLVNIRSDFWKQHRNFTLTNQTWITVGELKSGSLYEFEVQTVVGEVLKSEAQHISAHTDAELREISLSMMCSSAEPLFCDKEDTRTNVLEKLRSHFYNVLGEKNVTWMLNWRKN
ncbi:fibronectin-like [Thalassophryne amazonica]|uniref:fibronectin-like n=1 Tax=Thalassophryne amazonica TaxID=390379 RepID=UPI001471A1A3|nr:fibronectin-like [Thalassophryne amazonica]